jgi:hypothetical protein
MSGVRNGTDISAAFAPIGGPSHQELAAQFRPRSLDDIAREHQQQIEQSISDPQTSRRKKTNG